MALKKPTDFFEEKKLQEQLQQSVEPENSGQKVGRLKSPSDLFDPPAIIEEVEEVVENVEENIQEIEIDPIEEIRNLIEEVRSQIPNIPEIKTYDKELDLLKVDLDNVYHTINEIPHPKYYDEEIKSLEVKFNTIQIPEVRYYDKEILSLNEKIDNIEIPEVKYYDTVIEELDNKINSIKIPEVKYYDAELYNLGEEISQVRSNLSKLPKVKYYDQDIQELHQKIDNIEIPEVKYYDLEISSLKEEINHVKNDIPIVPEIKYYDQDIQELHQKISDIEIPEVKYYDTVIEELDNKINNIKIPEIKYYDQDIQELYQKISDIEIPEVKYYDQDILDLKTNISLIKSSIKEPKFYDEDIKELRKIISEIKEKQQSLSLTEGLLQEPSEIDNKDPLTPTNQNFATLEDLSNHYKLFINRIQQQLSTIGGGGETRLEFLDDVDRASAKTDGYYLKYDESLGKFIGSPVSGGSGSLVINGNDITLGTATTINFADNLTAAVSGGIATVSVSGLSTANISGYGIGLATTDYVNNLVSISTFSGNYNDLSNKPFIPTDTGDLTNNVGFVTSGIVVGYATEGYVNTAVANLVDSAPETLDTLNELAAALGDDANFSTTITNTLASKANLSGANFTGVVTSTSFIGNISSGVVTSSQLNVTGNAIISGITTLGSSNGIGTVTVGIGQTALFVDGDARVTGILTVGRSSITIDGDNNTIVAGQVLITGSSITLGDNVTIDAGATGINSAPNVIYVAKDGNDSSNGTSIDNAKLTIAGAVAIAQTGTTIKVLSGTYIENNPITLPEQVSIVGDSLREVSITPQNSGDIFYVTNGNYIANLSFVGAANTGAMVAFSPSGAGDITQSPYVQNCTNFIPNSIGVRINGAHASGNTKSIVVDSYTQYNQGGIGVSITNEGYGQLVSLFTICNDIAIYCGSGGACDLTNSNSSFGNYGLVSDGVGSEQYVGTITTAADVNSSTFVISGVGSNRPYDGQVVYFDDLYYEVSKVIINDGGSGYTTAPTLLIEDPLTSWGIAAQAVATVVNGTITEIDIISTGRGYTTTPNITISGGGGSGLSLSIEITPKYYLIESATLPSNGISTITTTESVPYAVGIGSTVPIFKQSRILASGHSFEYIGSGVTIANALPSTGGVAIQANEIDMRNGGLVVYTSTDQSGNFRIGDGVVINQNTGSISGTAYVRSLYANVTPLILALGG